MSTSRTTERKPRPARRGSGYDSETRGLALVAQVEARLALADLVLARATPASRDPKPI